MGEDLTPFLAEFNGSLRIEARAERLTSEAGAVILREVVERLGVVPWMVERLRDPRDPRSRSCARRCSRRPRGG